MASEKEFDQNVQEQMGHDVGNIWTHLVGELQQGKEWVAYPDIEKVSQEDLRTFDTKEEARDYALDRSNVAVIFDYHLIERITGALDPLVESAIDRHFDLHPSEPAKELPKGRDEEMEIG